MTYCKNCGTVIGDTVAFCAGCGTKADGEQPPQSYQPPPQNYQQPYQQYRQPYQAYQPQPTPAKKKGPVGPILIWAAIVGVLGAVLYGFVATINGWNIADGVVEGGFVGAFIGALIGLGFYIIRVVRKK